MISTKVSVENAFNTWRGRVAKATREQADKKIELQTVYDAFVKGKEKEHIKAMIESMENVGQLWANTEVHFRSISAELSNKQAEVPSSTNMEILTLLKQHGKEIMDSLMKKDSPAKAFFGGGDDYDASLGGCRKNCGGGGGRRRRRWTGDARTTDHHGFE